MRATDTEIAKKVGGSAIGAWRSSLGLLSSSGYVRRMRNRTINEQAGDDHPHGDGRQAFNRRARDPGDALALQEEERAHSGHSEQSLNALAVSATTHCLTGCAIGEVAGMAIGTAFGWGNLATVALAVGLAYLFGFGLTSLPLFRAGLTLTAIVPIALAADTVSITIMEIIDNAFVLLIPGAMDAGLGDVLLWASVAGGFVVAYPFAFLANRYLIARGKGHAVVHEYHH